MTLQKVTITVNITSKKERVELVKSICLWRPFQWKLGRKQMRIELSSSDYYVVSSALCATHHM